MSSLTAVTAAFQNIMQGSTTSHTLRPGAARGLSRRACAEPSPDLRWRRCAASSKVATPLWVLLESKAASWWMRLFRALAAGLAIGSGEVEVSSVFWPTTPTTFGVAIAGSCLARDPPAAYEYFHAC